MAVCFIAPREYALDQRYCGEQQKRKRGPCRYQDVLPGSGGDPYRSRHPQAGGGGHVPHIPSPDKYEAACNEPYCLRETLNDANGITFTMVLHELQRR